jgi:hypothetical protein
LRFGILQPASYLRIFVACLKSDLDRKPDKTFEDLLVVHHVEIVGQPLLTSMKFRYGYKVLASKRNAQQTGPLFSVKMSHFVHLREMRDINV